MTWEHVTGGMRAAAPSQSMVPFFPAAAVFVLLISLDGVFVCVCVYIQCTQVCVCVYSAHTHTHARSLALTLTHTTSGCSANARGPRTGDAGAQCWAGATRGRRRGVGAGDRVPPARAASAAVAWGRGARRRVGGSRKGRPPRRRGGGGGGTLSVKRGHRELPAGWATQRPPRTPTGHFLCEGVRVWRYVPGLHT
jgi:hypothetical protein